MKKYSFKNDYSEGCHPKILEMLSKTNYEQQQGYGDDIYCEKAIEILKEKIGNNDVDIHFVSGGTQANTIVITSVLKSFEAVISASTGHINVHECGAIEATGHKIILVPSKDGKVKPNDIIAEINKAEDHHMVRPAMVYISNATEVGTVYTKQELTELSVVCRKNKLYLFLDGARLGSAMSSAVNDLSLSDLSRLTDVFYIGGTKNGAIIGEAIVINNDNLKKDFNFHIKQRGALLSKGRLMGIQFLALFQDNLYFDLAQHANNMAKKIADSISKKSYTFLTNPVSNQIFPILPNTLIAQLEEKYEFYVWQKIDDVHSALRLVTSWATLEEKVDEFISDITSF
ncbi:MAG: low specificity L-threonine aldolase [Bacteroidetes bacterium]|nr:low specificity L-threonine aldolase [Bacteroidota bacterium]